MTTVARLSVISENDKGPSGNWSYCARGMNHSVVLPLSSLQAASGTLGAGLYVYWQQAKLMISEAAGHAL